MRMRKRLRDVLVSDPAHIVEALQHLGRGPSWQPVSQAAALLLLPVEAMDT
jgi:hypothetical protein